MLDHPALADLPAAALRQLGEHYRRVAEELLRRAARAEAMAADRARARARKAARARIWQTVEGLKLSGLQQDAAVDQAAHLLSLDPAVVAANWQEAERTRGPHQRARRNLEIARRAAAGVPDAAIAAALGLHPKSVARLRRQLARARAFDLPGRVPTMPDGRLWLPRLEPARR